MHNYRGEVNPSTACRNPKKRHLMRGKTGIQLIRPLFVILIVGIFLLPFMGDQNNNPINSFFQEPFNQTYGSSGYNEANSLVQTLDGGFVLAGLTRSYDSSEMYDMWLVKTDANGVMIWNQTYGGSGWDDAFDLVQTTDGGFALTGYTKLTDGSGYNMWLVKTDANGVVQWDRTYGGDYGSALIQTSDGGFALVGSTEFYDRRRCDMRLVKTDANGTIQPLSNTSTPLSATISSSTPSSTTLTPGWEPLPLLVAVVVLAMWHRRKQNEVLK